MNRYPSSDGEMHYATTLLGAKPWQLELLKLNPRLCLWGPGKGGMTGDGDEMTGHKSFASWRDFGPWYVDETTRIAEFYFQVVRDTAKCHPCGGWGYNPETKKLNDAFYDYANMGGRWCDSLTQDEVDALWDGGRLKGFTEKPAPGMLHTTFVGHDRQILVETRAKRLGVWGQCPECSGQGIVYRGGARLQLVLWFLHTRRGVSRTVDVELQEHEIPGALDYLTDAARCNEAQFRNAVEFRKVQTANPEALPLLAVQALTAPARVEAVRRLAEGT